jgi:hypothetical protein
MVRVARSSEADRRLACAPKIHKVPISTTVEATPTMSASALASTLCVLRQRLASAKVAALMPV